MTTWIIGSQRTVERAREWFSRDAMPVLALGEGGEVPARTALVPGRDETAILLADQAEAEIMSDVRGQMAERYGLAGVGGVFLADEIRSDILLRALRLGYDEALSWSEPGDRASGALRRLGDRVRASGRGVRPVRLPGDPALAIEEFQAVKKLRNRHFPECAADDAVFDIMLYVLQTHYEGVATTVLNACNAATMPVTTALRRVEDMITQGLLIRRADAQDKRRNLILPSQQLLDRFGAFLEDLGKPRRQRARGRSW